MKRHVSVLLLLMMGSVLSNKEVKEDLKPISITASPVDGVRDKAYELANKRFPNNKRMRDYHAERILSGWGY